MEPLGGRHEITAEWLTEALREGGHLPRGRVSEVQVNTDGIASGHQRDVRIVPPYEGGMHSAQRLVANPVAATSRGPESVGGTGGREELLFYRRGGYARRAPPCYGRRSRWRSYAPRLKI